MSPYVTVILPCYNEEGHVLAEVDRITKVMDDSGYSYELLAIDDGSTDQTLGKLQSAAADYPHMKVVPMPRNGGSGVVRRIGTQRAQGEIVVWTDADMTYPNERIPELVQVLEKDPTVDQVVGARTSEQGTHKLLGYLPSGSSAGSPSGSPARRYRTSTRGCARSAARCHCRTCDCCPRVLLRHHHHAGVLVEQPRDPVRPDRVLAAGGQVQVQVRLGRLQVHPAGAAHGDVLQPAQGADAAGADAAGDRRGEGDLRRGRAPGAHRRRHR